MHDKHYNVTRFHCEMLYNISIVENRTCEIKYLSGAFISFDIQLRLCVAIGRQLCVNIDYSAVGSMLLLIDYLWLLVSMLWFLFSPLFDSM